MKRVAIIIPAYNEEKRIASTLESYSNYFNSLKKENKINYEILVVINNTKDRTEDVVKGFVRKNKNIRYTDELNPWQKFTLIPNMSASWMMRNPL